jgi:hypothetical protein
MPLDLLIPLTMKIMALGRPLSEAERIAAVIVVEVVLLCALSGYVVGLPGFRCGYDGQPEYPAGYRSAPASGAGLSGTCGIYPAPCRDAGAGSRTLLHQ